MTCMKSKQRCYESSERSLPEAALTRLKPDVSFRDQLDIDSMDFLNSVIALDEELDVRIRESDYPKLSTLDACAELLSSWTTIKENVLTEAGAI